MKLYAALVDKDCTGYSYSSGIPHGYNCWMAWLTAGDTYKSKSAGSGTAFHSVTVSSTEASQSWTTVPTTHRVNNQKTRWDNVARQVEDGIVD